MQTPSLSRRTLVGGSLAVAFGGATSLLAPRTALAQTDRSTQKKQMAETVDTSKFEKAGPYTIGVAAGYMKLGTRRFHELVETRWAAPAPLREIQDAVSPGLSACQTR